MTTTEIRAFYFKNHTESSTTKSRLLTVKVDGNLRIASYHWTLDPLSNIHYPESPGSNPGTYLAIETFLYMVRKISSNKPTRVDRTHIQK
jgi:hypothetical protein